MRRLTVVAVSLLLVLTFGCKAKKALDAAAISHDLDKRGTTDLMKEIADDKYDPPADGKLTDAQIKMYLKVREHEKEIAKVAHKELAEHEQKAKESGEKSISGMMEAFKGLGSVADIATADLRAAKDLGYNTAEYQWVKGQVLAVSTYAMQEKLQQATSAMADSAYQQMKKAYDEAKDDTTRKMYADMLAQYDKNREDARSEQEKPDPAVVYNRQLLNKYDNELNALAAEMTKWSGNEEESKKEVNEFEQKLDKAASDAKKQAQ
ncbi:MAG: hypothetical protein WBX15_21055 [Thermoanaerobaculia bacterium]